MTTNNFATIGEVIELLKKHDPDMPFVVGAYQSRCVRVFETNPRFGGVYTFINSEGCLFSNVDRLKQWIRSCVCYWEDQRGSMEPSLWGEEVKKVLPSWFYEKIDTCITTNSVLSVSEEEITSFIEILPRECVYAMHVSFLQEV